jgi:hypothetical protein
VKLTILDMLGSPNFIYQIYNGSGADPDIRTASETIQQVFEGYFDNNETPYELSPFTGRSDYGVRTMERTSIGHCRHFCLDNDQWRLMISNTIRH